MKDAKDKEGRSVEMLGRSGLKFIDKGRKYYIDSEMLKNPNFDVVLFWESTRYFDEHSNELLSDTQKREIVSIVVDLLAKGGIRADIMK